MSLKDVRSQRLCMCGTKGIVWPLDECEGYEAKVADCLTRRQAGAAACIWRGVRSSVH